MVKIDDLFKLFETSGFLYQEKKDKLDIERAKKNIDMSYYGDHHKPFFVYDGDELKAHIAMLNLHGGTWISHHHCSVKYGAGIKVVSDLSLNVADNYRDMNYMLAFYQPHKKFVKRIWEGIFYAIDEFKYCDIYPFGLVNDIKPCDNAYSLNRFYSNDKDTLLTNAFLGEGMGWEETGTYLHREIFRIIGHDECATVVKYRSSYGLSLSHYNNSFYVISETGRPISDKMIGFIRTFSNDPILRYPIGEGDKAYNCWIMPTTEEAGLKYFMALEGRVKDGN
jgi:hypothetical protein